MLGVEAIPAILYTIMVLQIPNSPRWLAVNKQDGKGALETLKLIYEDSEANEKLNEIKESLSLTQTKEGFFSGKYKIPLLLAFLFAFFNQLSGINFVLYYAPGVCGYIYIYKNIYCII